MAEAVAPPPETTVKKSFVTALRRGPAAIKPEVLGTKVEEATQQSKDDPRHPLRGGGARRRVYAPRPARIHGSTEWLARQLDPAQVRTLRIAFRKYERMSKRLELCKRQRETGIAHRQLPLSLGTKCTETTCSCDPDYRALVGMLGGMGDGTTTFVSHQFATWRREAKLARE